MKKVVIHRPGDFDRLVVEDHPDPVPAPGEVRVSTRAIGVNFADCIVRMGLYKSAKEFVGWPVTPGFEFSGVVSALGAGVTDLALGAEVFGVTRFGAYATEVCVPRRQLRPLPKNLSLEQGGAFPTVFLTAWYALYEAARLRAGSRVLIHSAAGGVGGAALQIAKNAGAFVVGVVGSAHKVESVQRAGANAVIDKSHEDLWRAAERHSPEGYHIVLEANGAETMRQSYAHLRPAGRLVVYGFQAMMTRKSGRPNWLKLAWDYLRLPRFNPLQMTDANKGVVAFNLSYLFDESERFEEALGALLTDVDNGRLQPPPITAFPFDQVAEAHRALQSGDTVGKLVLVP
jgi:NADPH:quinone reductase-like Zn-dependent oxidoreductase